MVRQLLTVIAASFAVFSSAADFYPTLWYRPFMPKTPQGLSLSADGLRLAIDGSAVHVLTPILTGITSYAVPNTTLRAEISPNGQLLAATSTTSANGVSLIRLSDGAEIFRLIGPTTAPSSIAFSPNGAWLAAAEPAQNAVHIWHVSTGTYVQSIHVTTPSMVEWADNDKVLVVNNSESITMVSNETGGIVQTYDYPGKTIRVLAVAAKGQKFAVSDYSSVLVTDVNGGATRFISSDATTSFALSADSKRIAVGGATNLRLYDTATSILLWNSGVPSFKSVVYSQDGSTLYCLGNTVTVCDALRGRAQTSIGSLIGANTGSISGNGAYCSVMNMGVFRTLSGLRVGKGDGGSISPDGKSYHSYYFSMARKTSDGTLLWNGKQFLDVWLSNYSPDGQLVAVGVGVETRPRDLHIYHSQSGQIFTTIPNLYTAIGRFSSDGAHFVISGQRPRLFRTSDWSQIWEKVDSCFEVSFSEDMSKVFFKRDGAVVARNLTDGTEIGQVSTGSGKRLGLGADSEVVLVMTPNGIDCFRFSDGVKLRTLKHVTFTQTSEVSMFQDDSTRYLFVTADTACSVIANPYFMAGNTPPTTVSMVEGVLESGDVAKLAKSDNQVAMFGKGVASKVTTVVEGSAPLGQTVVMRMLGKCDSDQVVAKVELFDYTTGQYSDSKTVALNPSAFSRATVVPANATRFRDVLTGQVRARLTFEGVDPNLPNWKVSVDQAAWQVSP